MIKSSRSIMPEKEMYMSGPCAWDVIFVVGSASTQITLVESVSTMQRVLTRRCC